MYVCLLVSAGQVMCGNQVPLEMCVIVKIWQSLQLVSMVLEHDSVDKERRLEQDVVPFVVGLVCMCMVASRRIKNTPPASSILKLINCSVMPTV